MGAITDDYDVDNLAEVNTVASGQENIKLMKERTNAVLESIYIAKTSIYTQ